VDVGGTGVSVGGKGVAVERSGVAVGGGGVGVGGIGVAVGGIAVGVGAAGCEQATSNSTATSRAIAIIIRRVAFTIVVLLNGSTFLNERFQSASLARASHLQESCIDGHDDGAQRHQQRAYGRAQEHAIIRLYRK
jgi:hypothetical protein